MTPNSGIKNKHPEEEEEDSDADQQEVKRLKKEEVETESEEKRATCHEDSSLSDTLESSKDTCGQDHSGTSCNTSAISEDHGKFELFN